MKTMVFHNDNPNYRKEFLAGRSSLQLALVQCSPLPPPASPNTVSSNLTRLQKIVSVLAANHDVIVFPEMFLTGYNIGLQAVNELAECAQGPSAQIISDIARDYEVSICYGYPEKTTTGQIYNAAQLFTADGNSALQYHKSQLYGDFDRACFQQPSYEPKICTVKGWNIGILICYDIEFPELVRILALHKADLIIAPTGNMAQYHCVPRILVPARALENQVYIGYANYTGCEDSLEYCGFTSIVGPDGEFLASAGFNHSASSQSSTAVYGLNETIISATLSSETLLRSREGFPYLKDRFPALYGSLCEFPDSSADTP